MLTCCYKPFTVRNDLFLFGPNFCYWFSLHWWYHMFKFFVCLSTCHYPSTPDFWGNDISKIQQWKLIASSQYTCKFTPLSLANWVKASNTERDSLKKIWMGILTLNSVLCKWLCIPVSHLCWQEETCLKRKLLGNGEGEAGRTNPNLAEFQSKKMKPATCRRMGETRGSHCANS